MLLHQLFVEDTDQVLKASINESQQKDSDDAETINDTYIDNISH